MIERRTLPGEPDGIGLDEVTAIVADAAVPPGMGVAVGEVIRRSPWQLASGAATELADLLGEGLGSARRDFPYWMETPLWDAAGIPAVVCGPAGGGLHAVDEWVDLGQLRRYPAVVVDVVHRFLRG